jgi:hypothetical protein
VRKWLRLVQLPGWSEDRTGWWETLGDPGRGKTPVHVLQKKWSAGASAGEWHARPEQKRYEISLPPPSPLPLRYGRLRLLLSSVSFICIDIGSVAGGTRNQGPMLADSVSGVYNCRRTYEFIQTFEVRHGRVASPTSKATLASWDTNRGC